MSTRTGSRARGVQAGGARALIHSDPEDFRSFAIDSISKVIRIAKTIEQSDAKALQFCKALGAVLWTIRSHLQKQRQGQAEGQTKVEGLLNNLERLCIWPRSLRQDASSGTNRWPTFKARQFDSDRATKCLRSFAIDGSNKKRQGQLIEKLEGLFAKSSKDESIAVTTRSIESASSASCLREIGHELDDDIQRLCSTLRRYQSCELEGSHREIITNIRLNGYKSVMAGDATAEFGVFFFDHPHAGECHWQEACIQICHPRSAAVPKIRFCDDEPQQSDQYLASSTAITRNDFCTTISCRAESRLLLSAQNGEFLLKGPRDTSRNWSPSQPAISLATLLDKRNTKFSDKMKAILALLLAKATWQFYDSELIGQGLTKDNVYFLFERRGDIHGVFINEPMLLIRCEQINNDSKDGRDTIPTAMIHDMPKILALGLLLLELETEKSMEKYQEEQNLYPEGRVNINTNYKIAKRLVDADDPSCILFDMLTHSPFLNILPMCIKAGELARKLNETLSSKRKVVSSTLAASNALRSVIYEQIVRPLEAWVNSYHKPDTVGALYKLPPGGAPAIPRSIREPPHVKVQPVPQASVGPANSQEVRQRQDSRDWFSRYEILKRILQPQGGETGVGYEQVKIAVLDTGIKNDDYEYYQEYGIIKKYKDYVTTDHGGVTCDETGHGSAAVTLLVKTCPNASLYIARVLKTNIATSREVVNVEKAIDWAIDHNVNIITMALGFEEDQPLIGSAIKRARARQILVFSAASNARNTRRIYCPANRIDQVFCIFSTNAGNRESRSLNPGPTCSKNSLAIFGDGVEHEEGAALLRGTSYSTSIAAGLAAMLLDFSRQDTHKAKIPDISRLGEMQGMMKVLREMAVSDGRYACIRPLSLLTDRLKFAMREIQREWIRGTIERCLENMYEDPS